jgi:hypothetical protein
MFHLIILDRELQWTEECNCNSGKPNFDVIEFSTTNSRIELVCGKCHCVICWWPISTEQTSPSAAHGTKKSSPIPTKLQIE